VKIAYLNASGTVGGAERCLLDMMVSVRESADDILPILIAPAEGPLADAALKLGIETRIVPMPDALAAAGDSSLVGSWSVAGSLRFLGRTVAATLALRSYVRALREALRAIDPDLVHSNGLKLHLVSRLLRLRKPIVWHLHDYLGLRPVMTHVLRWASRRAHTGIAVSRSVAEDTRRALPDLAIETVHNAVDSVTFAPGSDRAPLDELSGLPSEPAVRVGLIATYARWKGHALFLEAAASAAAVRRDLRFYVVGGPIYQTSGSQIAESDLRDQARRLGIADRVGFINFQEDVASVYRALDVCVHASTQPEPFGLTIVEAMACGRAVIVSREGGAAEIFTDGENALGFQPRDSASLGAAIVSLASDTDGRARLGERARQTVLERFSRERLSREILAIYGRVLALSPPGIVRHE
jgi:glycosyltransferase involved in cell wall biosynthesis